MDQPDVPLFKGQGILDAPILIVDDHPANLEIYQEQLRRAGYRNLLSISDPERVLEVCRGYNPALVILDIMMPVVDGFGVMAMFREAGIQASVLAVTANHAIDIRLKALAQGAQDFLTKPYEAAELIARVRNMLLGHLAQQWLADQNNTLESVVQERTEELRRSRFELIAALGRAAEHRDEDTANHTVRVGEMARLLGMKLGLSPETSRLLRHAAPMHDIGKIGTPDHILLAPRRLVEAEMVIMRRHAAIGARIIGPHHADVLLVMAHEIALSHHEKWDGSGYPGGLCGEAIPLSGRIVALVDVFDALITRRPYKEPWPLQRAVALIQEEGGRHFDAQLTGIFLDSMAEVLEIRAQYPDQKEE